MTMITDEGALMGAYEACGYSSMMGAPAEEAPTPPMLQPAVRQQADVGS